MVGSVEVPAGVTGTPAFLVVHADGHAAVLRNVDVVGGVGKATLRHVSSTEASSELSANLEKATDIGMRYISLIPGFFGRFSATQVGETLSFSKKILEFFQKFLEFF